MASRGGTPVPDGWHEARLGDAIVPSSVRRRPGEMEPEILSCSKDYGVIPQNQLFGKRLASADTSRYKLVYPGDFVYDPNLLWSGAIARSSLTIAGLVSPVYEVFKAAEATDASFLAAWLKSPARLSQYQRISVGTNVRRRRASIEDLASLPILLPPLPEQRAIAAVLGSIDEAIERTDEVIAATERLRDALLHELLTRGLPGHHTAWRDVPGLGTIPSCWEVVRLGDVLDSTTYGTNVALAENGAVPVLRMNNIQDGEVDTTDVRRGDLSEADVQTLDLVSGDILFNRTNSRDLVGKVAVVRNLPQPISFASYLVRLRVKRDLADPFWLAALLCAPPCQGRIRRLATPGVSQANVNPTSLKSITVPLPPLPEQRAIAASLDGVDAAVEGAREERAALQSSKASTADALLTGRVRIDIEGEGTDVPLQ